MADNTTNKNPQQDIIDNLLVKEETGNLHYLQEKKSNSKSDNSSNISNNSDVSKKEDDTKFEPVKNTNDDINKMAVAPENDNFVHETAPQENSKDKSELSFHPEDKKQIVRLSESVPVDDSKKYSIEKIIAKILSKQNIALDDNNKALFSNLILDFFRNRKSAISVRELLATKIISNEKTLPAEIVDNVLSIIKSLKKKIDGEGGLVVGAEELKKEITKPEVKPIKPVEKTEPAENIKTTVETKKEVAEEKPAETKVVEEKAQDFKKVSPEVIMEGEAEPKLETDPVREKGAGAPKKEEEPESEGLVKPVKFGEEPKGMEEEEKEDSPLAEIKQDEIEDSLKEIQNIMPNMASNNKQDIGEEDEELLKKLAIDGSDKSEEKSSIKPQEDLHDIGQLMTEDVDEDKKEEEDADDDGFVIKKVKPAVVSSDDSTKDSKKSPIAVAENKTAKPADQSNLGVGATPEKDTISDNKTATENNISKQAGEAKIDTEMNSNLENENSSSAKSNEGSQSTPTVEKVQNKKTEKDTLPKVVRPGQTFSVKPKISDVQEARPNATHQKHVLTGPVEELNNMTLRNFRFLGTNAKDRTNKILEKINILEQDSYTKKVEGVKAWRNSPVNRLYLDLGAEGMSSGKNIEVLINEKKTAGEEVIDMAEFDAISDLNKDLRF